MEGISVSENNQMTLDRTKVSEEDKWSPNNIWLENHNIEFK